MVEEVASNPVSPLVGETRAAVQRIWPSRASLSSLAKRADAFLDNAGFDKAPWLAVLFAFGIGLWFVLPDAFVWSIVIGSLLFAAAFVTAATYARGSYASLTMAIATASLAIAAGMATIWVRSEVVGTAPLDRPGVQWVEGRILEREEQPALDRTRLTVATRDPIEGRAIKVRLNIPNERDDSSFDEGATIRVRARLMPPAPPMLPGGYDFARTAWFSGLYATGSILGQPELIASGQREDKLARTQRYLSAHVSQRVDGSAGAIAAAFASGDRGAITKADDAAMRDAGLTHLLSISGLHVSAVIAAGYFLASKLLALWPWLALRVRLPIVAAAVGALGGVGYTLLTGAEVPTVRSCIGALLVLFALVLGREPLSLRMVAVAAFFVMLLWPEAVIGPSFQMSFAAVIAIVALHGSAAPRAFLAPRDESVFAKYGRRVAMLFVTGLVIEIALTPIVLYHFHRSGIYGAFANVLAIPLVTFVSMPFIAIALAMDMIGIGAPFWWVVEKSLDLLLAIARFIADQPGAVRLFPQMGVATIFCFVAGFLWIALWRGRARAWGLMGVGAGALLLAGTPAPDILVSRDGRHVGIVDSEDRLLLLREARTDYARDNLIELSATRGVPVQIVSQPNARCNDDFCAFSIQNGARDWRLLLSRSGNRVDERDLSIACSTSDLVISDRYLPRSCRPRWLKADRAYLQRNGGIAIDLSTETIATVADQQGKHGWWLATAEEN